MIASAGAAPSRATAARVVVQVVCLLVVLAAGLVPNVVLETASNAIFDAYQRFAPMPRKPSQIVLVDVDDESLARIGQWPWRRDRLARLIEAVAGARVVGLDILLTEPDRLSPEALLADRPDLAPEITQAVAALPRPDTVLATSMRGVKLVLAATARTGGYNKPDSPVATTPIFETGSDLRPTLPRYGSVAWPLPAFVAAARGVGLVSTLSEPDGITRRVPVIFAVGPALMPSFAAEVLRVATDAERIGLRAAPSGDRELDIGDRRVEIDAAGRAWPQFGRHLAAQSIPAYRLLDGTADPALFRDRIVLIGVGAAGLGDVTITPVHQAESTLAIQAQLIDSMLAGDVLWRPPLATAAETLLSLVLGAAALLLLGRVPDRVYGALFAAAATVLIVGSIVAFQTAGLLLDWTFPLATLIATMLVALVFRIRDEVGARRRHEQQLALALMKAEAADRAKTEFLANANHELRTPLTAILGFSEVMAKQLLGPLSPRYAEYAHDIHKTAEHLHLIISDILDLAVIDLGGKEPADDRVDVAAVIADCARMTPVSRGGGIRIRIELAAALPRLRADARMVKQMLINLLSNAIKYSPPHGEVVIRAETCADGGLAVTVLDSGAGIAAADVAYAMEPFGRLRSSALAQEPGIGIGLPLTKSMVELHGGRLTLKSEVGIGTEVRLWFPPSRIAAAQGVS